MAPYREKRKKWTVEKGEGGEKLGKGLIGGKVVKTIVV